MMGKGFGPHQKAVYMSNNYSRKQLEERAALAGIDEREVKDTKSNYDLCRLILRKESEGRESCE